MEPAAKRRRLSNHGRDEDTKEDGTGSLPRSLSHSISPPPRKRRAQNSPACTVEARAEEARATATLASSETSEAGVQTFSSPFQLTWIRDLPESANKDAVTLRDLLGDPLIAECWEFNYLHDVDFLMAAFDEDVRSSVQVHLVHGFWKKEDPSRLMLEVSPDRLLISPAPLTYQHHGTGASRGTQECHSALRVHARDVRDPSFQDADTPST